MKSFTTVTLLLAITGILGTCTARNIAGDDNQDRGSSSSKESSETKVWLRGVETACFEKTGSNQTFEALLDTFATIPMCYLMKVDVFKLMDDFRHLNASTRHVFFPKYCPQIRNAIPCFELPLKQLSSCFDDDILQYKSLNAASEVLGLVCENDGEILFEDGANYEVCMQNMSNYVVECNALVSTSTTKLMAVSKYGETQCGELSKLRHCMERKFNECNGPRLIDVQDVYWNALLKDTPCSNLTAETFEEDDDRTRNEIA